MALRLLAAMLAALAALRCAAEQDWRISDLERRQAASSDGVIRLDDAAVRQLAASSGRPYALLVFFDALHIKERSELKLEELRSEFGLLASSYNKGMSRGSQPRVFFCSLEYQQSQESFRVFDVRSLPHVRYLAPGSSRPTEAEAVDMNGETSRSAEGLAAFIEARTGRKVGPIARPPLLSGRQLTLLAAVVAMVAGWAKRRAASLGRTPLHDPRVWCAGSILVYFFSVSGGMHNIIRRMPLFMADKREPGKLIFFYQGSGAQLGAEGFAVGYLYTVLGLALAFVTHLLPSLSSTTFQRLAMLVAMLACFWSASKVVSLDNWKTGYSIHAYLPKAWQ